MPVPPAEPTATQEAALPPDPFDLVASEPTSQLTDDLDAPAPPTVIRDRPLVAGPEDVVPAAATVVTTTAPEENRRRPALIAAAIGIVLVLVAGVVLLVSGGGDDGEDGEGEVASSEAPKVSFAAEVTELGRATRTWTVEDGRFSGSVVVVNDTDAATSGTHVEVIPKSLADHVDKIRFEPAVSEVIEEDPVVAWRIEELAAGEKRTFRYEIDVADDAGEDELEKWKADAEKAAADHRAKAGEPPALVVIAPTNGDLLPVPAVDITGTTDPGATVTMNGTPVTVAEDGSWAIHAVLVLGQNPIEVVATGKNGKSTSAKLTVTHAPPTDEPTAVEQPTTTVRGSTGTTTTVRNRPDTTVKCWDGSTARNEASCPQRPQPTVKCWNGSTAPNEASCPQRPTTTVKCWNGSTAPNAGACPTRPPAPIAVGDDWSWTPIYDGGWYWAHLPVLANDTPNGTVSVETMVWPVHGNLRWANGRYEYQPHHNGSVGGLYDTFAYRLRNTMTGDVSETVVVHVRLNCNPAYQCYG